MRLSSRSRPQFYEEMIVVKVLKFSRLLMLQDLKNQHYSPYNYYDLLTSFRKEITPQNNPKGREFYLFLKGICNEKIDYDYIERTNAREFRAKLRE